MLLKKLDSPDLSSATNKLRNMIAEVKTASANRKLIFYGVMVLVIGAAATALIQTNLYTQAIAAVTAVGGLAATAGAWLTKLNALAQTGQEFEDEQQKMRQVIVEAVTAAHEGEAAPLRAVVADRLAIIDKLGEQLKGLEQAPTTARLALEELERQRAVALGQLEDAVRLGLVHK